MSPQVHMPCTGTMCRFDYEKATGWAIMRHTGHHDHPWPPAKKADPLAKQEFEKEVLKDPKKAPMKLKVRSTTLLKCQKSSNADNSLLFTLHT